MILYHYSYTFLKQDSTDNIDYSYQCLRSVNLYQNDKNYVYTSSCMTMEISSYMTSIHKRLNGLIKIKFTRRFFLKLS